MKRKQLLRYEKFTNIQKAQAGLSNLFKVADSSESFYRVLRNDEPLGVLVPNKMWDLLLEHIEDLEEDIEALNSPRYKRTIAQARKEIKEGKTISLEELKKELGL